MMKTINILLMLLGFLAITCVRAAGNERYVLPYSKAYLESCNYAALALHPGVIEVQREQHSDGNFRVHYQIMMPDSAEWIVVCDLADGKIIRNEQELSGDSGLKKDPAQ
ncbi:hypothetical protein [Candidatus Methylomicrobium oryzae]|jgi:hypothetical protein|uniref:hypothetical protein n=1 Tax=Candidatus Methylomicrobium oryzae TaxID=2802053 RepID=UPI0019229988|nr:hypothetical protein [Methylomicrobium sp. RS1]MBL1264372.1 hypothetical protein [Methylomicrobium sp. RS1]